MSNVWSSRNGVLSGPMSNNGMTRSQAAALLELYDHGR